jgi:hypothetical protein
MTIMFSLDRIKFKNNILSKLECKIKSRNSKKGVLPDVEGLDLSGPNKKSLPI